MISSKYFFLRLNKPLTAIFFAVSEAFLFLMLPLMPLAILFDTKSNRFVSLINNYVELRRQASSKKYYKIIQYFLKSKKQGKYSLVISGWCYQKNKQEKSNLYLVKDGEIYKRIKFAQIRLDVFKTFKTLESMFSGFEVELTEEEVLILDRLSICIKRKGELTPLLNKTNLLFPVAINNPDSGNIDSYFFKASYLANLRVQDIKNKELFVPIIYMCFYHKIFDFLKKISSADHVKLLYSKNIFYSHVQVKTLDQCEPQEVMELAPASKFSFYQPKFHPEVNSAKEMITADVPAERIVIQKDVKLIRANLVLTNKNEYLLWDPSAHPKHEMTAAHWQYVLGDSEDRDKAFILTSFTQEINMDEAILLNGRCSSNYYHWMIEYLPRFLEIKKQGLFKNYPVLIESNLPSTIKESLEILSEGKVKIIEIDPNVIYSVKTLVIPAMLTFQPDSIEYRFDEISGYNIDKYKFLRDFYIPLKSAREFPKKVYIGRKNQARCIKNNEEILSAIKECGFEMIDPSQLSFLEQVQLFNNADEIVLLAGAANSNTIFCKPGCKIYCFVADRNKFHYAHKIMADIGQADFTYVRGYDYIIRSLYRNPYHYMHADFYMNPYEVKSILKGTL